MSVARHKPADQRLRANTVEGPGLVDDTTPMRCSVAQVVAYEEAPRELYEPGAT